VRGLLGSMVKSEWGCVGRVLGERSGAERARYLAVLVSVQRRGCVYGKQNRGLCLTDGLVSRSVGHLVRQMCGCYEASRVEGSHGHCQGGPG
jgi:hypothetical protein